MVVLCIACEILGAKLQLVRRIAEGSHDDATMLPDLVALHVGVREVVEPAELGTQHACASTGSLLELARVQQDVRPVVPH